MSGSQQREPAEPRLARGSEGQRPEPGLARHLGELARHLDAEPDPDEMDRLITAAALREVPGAEHAGITVLHHGRLTSTAETSDLVARADALQYRLGQGPCIDSARREATIRADDLATDPRWPTFGPAVAALGVASMLSVQLYGATESIGALNIYAGRPAAFDSESESTAMLLAAHCGIALTTQHEVDSLGAALHTRDVIGQAKGILMERYKIGSAQAFRLLVGTSQRLNVKLADVADALTRTGELPTTPWTT